MGGDASASWLRRGLLTITVTYPCVSVGDGFIRKAGNGFISCGGYKTGRSTEAVG